MSGDNSRLGSYIRCSVAGETYQAFLPPALPPQPPLNLLGLQGLLSKANQALGKLDAVADILPDSNLLLYYYVRKEAVLSSQIEGTQSSLADLLLYESDEAPSVPVDDVVEVSSYVAALEHGLARVREGFPVSLRLIREMHAILLSKGRGSNKQPGEFRTSQNWIGGSRPGNAAFVPPPPDRLMECLDAFEKYLHLEERSYAALIDAGLIHVQFETIHPFLDGNGRIGRLLIAALLEQWGLLPEPLVYLSGYLKQHQAEYYRRLSAVRTEGDWEGWVGFFLDGVETAATDAERGIVAMASLINADRKRLLAAPRVGAVALRLFELLPLMPRFTIEQVRQKLDTTFPTATAAVKLLQDLGILSELTGQKKNRLFSYAAYVELLAGSP